MRCVGVLSREYVRAVLLGLPYLAAVVVSPGTLAQEAPTVQQIETSNYYTIRQAVLSNGLAIEQSIIHGPPVPPPQYGMERQFAATDEIERGIAQARLLSVPAFTWMLGCSAVSGGMIAAYYDRNGYPNIYTGPSNGGVMPTTSATWPTWVDAAGATYPNNPLIASRMGIDGRVSRGTINDYWVQYDSAATDPYVANGWSQHTWGESIGDFMFTSQSAYGNKDGSTGFWSYSSSARLTCDTLASYGFSDGTLGRRNFYLARGYSVTDCYNQKTDNVISGGFAFPEYQAEIDAGHPVMLNLLGHTVVGVGYDTATGNTVYLQDTWDTAVHSMTWGTSYSGMPLQSVSIVNLSPVAAVTYQLDVSTTGASGVPVAGLPIEYSGTTNYSRTGITGGTTVQLTAPASAGNAAFTSWSGCSAVSGLVCNIAMDSNKSVTATYRAPLSNNDAVTLSGAYSSETIFAIAVPAGATSLVVSLSGGSGDADLYLRQGAMPTLSQFVCRPGVSGNNETCTVASPASGTWYIMVRGNAAYSGVLLSAGYTLPIGVPTAPTITGIASGGKRLSITFSPPGSNGGASIVSYTATCVSSGQPARFSSSTTSPVVVRQLTAGQAYSCSVVATNSAGFTGPASKAAVAIPGRLVSVAPIWLLLE